MAPAQVTAWALCALLLVVAVACLVHARRLSAARGRARDGTDPAPRDQLDGELGEPLHGQLSWLPNRALLVEILDRALGRARRTHTRVATVLVDVDDFKETWERLGHR